MALEFIQLDRKHRAQRNGDDWALEELHANGHHRILDVWTGNRRSLMRKLEELNIHPTREAEQQLAAMPERKAFGPDRD